MTLSENIPLGLEQGPFAANDPEHVHSLLNEGDETPIATTPDTILDSHYNNIDRLLSNNTHLWRGCDMAGQGDHGHATGYPELDDILPGRGWPQNSLVEVVTPHWGMGELQLLMPYMRSITEQGKWILWISPPYLLYAPALIKAGIDTEQVLVVQLDTSCKDALWAIEKALQTESCGLVLAWQNWLSSKVIRRLQLAAETGQTLGVLFHHHDNRESSSPLRLKIDASRDGDYRSADVTTLKARGSYQNQTRRISIY